jgi:hypothetical protein
MLTARQRLMPLNLRFKSRAELREAAAEQAAKLNPAAPQPQPAAKPKTVKRARRKVPTRKTPARRVCKCPPPVAPTPPLAPAVVVAPAPEPTPATAPAAETTQPATV